MALAFNPGNARRVNIGSDASLDNMSAGTILVWLLIDGHKTDNYVYGKVSTGFADAVIAITRNTGYAALQVTRATSDLTVVTNTNVMSTGTWYFLGFQWDVAGANADQKIFSGSLSAAAVECGYSTQTVGSGAKDDESGFDAYIGNNINLDAFSYFNGDIAWFGLWNTTLNLGQIKAQQYRPYPTDNCVAFYHLGFNGTGTQPDLSGIGNNGTVTSATVATHVPLRIARDIIGVPYVVTAVSRRIFITHW